MWELDTRLHKPEFLLQNQSSPSTSSRNSQHPVCRDFYPVNVGKRGDRLGQCSPNIHEDVSDPAKAAILSPDRPTFSIYRINPLGGGGRPWRPRRHTCAWPQSLAGPRVRPSSARPPARAPHSAPLPTVLLVLDTRRCCYLLQERSDHRALTTPHPVPSTSQCVSSGTFLTAESDSV